MNFPVREHYETFVRKLAEGISPIDCFYLYGSYIRNDDFVPGRSDIDGGFILDSEFTTPKIRLWNLSRFLNACLREVELGAGISNSDPGISLNLNLMDRAVNKDGRFLAYDDSYAEYLKKHAKIAAGRDFVKEMNGMNYKRESLRSAAYNLRKVRNGLLTYFLDLRKNPKRAEKSVLSSIDILWGMPKKLLESLGKGLEFERGAFFETFKEIFPDYNPEVYKRAIALRRDPHGYFQVLENMEDAFNLSFEFLNATEEMIKTYVKRFPFPSELEMRSSSHSI